LRTRRYISVNIKEVLNATGSEAVHKNVILKGGAKKGNELRSVEDGKATTQSLLTLTRIKHDISRILITFAKVLRVLDILIGKDEDLRRGQKQL
jgi:hypothetical protein